MGGGKRHITRVIFIILGCAVLSLSYLYVARLIFNNTANKHWNSKRYQQRAGNRENLLMVDSCIALLRTGDLVVRRGDDMTSYMLSQMNLQEKSYSHCGLVVVEGGKPYVYHCIGGEDNPDEQMRKEPAEAWCSPVNNLAFAAYRYDADSISIHSLVVILDSLYTSKMMFDMDFDWQSNDRMYCSEMIYKTITSATGNERYIPLSKGYGRTFCGIDDLYRNGHAQHICQVRFK